MGPEDLDAVYRGLAAHRRRVLLTYLLEEATGSVAVDELVDAVVEAETHSPAPDRDEVAVDLHRSHLPVLEDVGFVDYDRDVGTVTPAGRMELAEPFVEFARDWASERDSDASTGE